MLLVFALLAPLASADPSDDYRAVHADWEDDAQITPCRWTVPQLENARAIADENPDDTYNGFPDRVDAKIVRWRRGDCDPRPRIAAVQAVRERVRIANRGGTTARIGGMRLRDRQGNVIRLARGLRVAPGRSVIVRNGGRPMWDDRGDVARLLANDGTIVSQYGYGRYRNTKRF